MSDSDFLRHQMTLDPAYRNFGLRLGRGPDRDELAAKGAKPFARLFDASPALRKLGHKTTVLWPALFRCWQPWRHGNQGTGDCVSWGTAHMLDVNLAVRAIAQKGRLPTGLLSSEAIYGFGKCELFNSYGYHGAGMNGIDAVAACKKFGTLYRQKYPSIDLTNYSGARAIAWGERPQQTRGVPDELEPIAREHLALDYALIDDVDEAAACLESGRALQFCGMSAPWAVQRGSDGMGSRFTSGAHCMTCTGMFCDSDGTPAWWWIANTGHGNHVSGPLPPGIDCPAIYGECGGPIPTRLFSPILRAGDCYTIDVVGGWEPLDLSEFGWPGTVLG